jgi:hypothetical protein
VGDGFGVNIHYTQGAAGESQMMAKAFRVARIDLFWRTVESVCGKYDWSRYDALLAEMRNVSVRPYWILTYSNTCYQAWTGCHTDQCVSAYANFTAAAVQRYRNHSIIFETVNEPDGMGNDTATQITALTKAAWPAFAALNETLVGPCPADMHSGYLNGTFAAGILDSLSECLCIRIAAPIPRR